jgi:adenylate cyclase
MNCARRKGANRLRVITVRSWLCGVPARIWQPSGWQVKARLDPAINDRGAVQLKNIADPVRVYSLKVGVPAQAKPAAPAERAVPEKPSPRLALSDKPSIAVLAFQNMSGDPEQEYFADGITEDVITDLSKVRTCW